GARPAALRVPGRRHVRPPEQPHRADPPDHRGREVSLGADGRAGLAPGDRHRVPPALRLIRLRDHPDPDREAPAGGSPDHAPGLPRRGGVLARNRRKAAARALEGPLHALERLTVTSRRAHEFFVRLYRYGGFLLFTPWAALALSLTVGLGAWGGVQLWKDLGD